MATLDYSKFRFRIGDTILYDGKECAIAAYYFAIEFNNFNNYGYTIRVTYPGHDGHPCSYDENGEHIIFPDKHHWYIRESVAVAINKSPDLSVHYKTTNDFSKAKPGDKVIVKPLIHNPSDYQFGVNEYMREMEGEIKTIRTIREVDASEIKLYPANYEIFLEDDTWTWSDAMLDLIVKDSETSNPIIKIQQKVSSLFQKEKISIELHVKKKKPKLTFNL